MPAVIQFLLLTPGVDETDFCTLRAILYGASPITDSRLSKAMETFGCEFIQVYGLTETTGAITQLDPEFHDPVDRPDLAALVRQALRVGGDAQWSIPSRATDVPTGTVGELWTRSTAEHEGLLAQRERNPGRARPTTGGSRPATRASTTRTASCSSTIASRT